jgi:L-fuculose-phosphate aldolase
VTEMDDPRFTVAAARRILARADCDSGVLGLVSVRDPDGASLWANMMEHGDVSTAASVVRLPLDLPDDAELGPVSPAVRVHLALYALRPDIGAVVHTHSHFAAVVASSGRLIGMFNEMATLYHEGQTCAEDRGEGSAASARRLAGQMGEHRVLLLKGHGVVVAGADVAEATIDALAVEKTARWHVESSSYGGSEILLAHTLQTKPLYEQYFRRNMWAANVRRLRRSDPDLFEPHAPPAS